MSPTTDGTMTERLELDDSQRAVVAAGADARLLVIAGAGQGKTEVVASRIAYLVEEEELSASSEMMVLSFSRAAVHVVRTRLEAREVARVDVRTFDSLASYILAQCGVEPVGDFASRVRQATGLLADRDNELDEIENIGHLILDEVQDLVGDRAEMTLALLDRLDESAGFTALGDPLQGIYDFTLEKSTSKMTSAEFLDRLVSVYGATRVALQHNYRARGAFPRNVIQLGESLRSESESEAADTLVDFEYSLPHSGEITDWGFLNDADTGRTAILCATNGEVLRVSRFLTSQSVDHVVRRQARDFGAARWVAEVFEDFAGPEVPRVDVESAIERELDGALRDEAWYLLKGAEGRTRTMNQLNLPRLRSLIASGSVPLTLTEPDTAQVIVSTIHRAKGLEFERAYLVHPNSPVGDQRDWRVLREKYVAFSRARDEVAMLDIPNGWSKFEKRNGRQRERKRSKSGKWYTAAIEFGTTDSRDSAPTPGDTLRARNMQRHLRDAKPGEVITAHHDAALSDIAGELLFVLCDAAGNELGITDTWFGNALRYDFDYWFREGWGGVTIDGLRLTAVDTVACDPRLTDAAGLGESGLWLVPRAFGLVTPNQD